MRNCVLTSAILSCLQLFVYATNAHHSVANSKSASASKGIKSMN